MTPPLTGIKPYLTILQNKPLLPDNAVYVPVLHHHDLLRRCCLFRRSGFLVLEDQRSNLGHASLDRLDLPNHYHLPDDVSNQPTSAVIILMTMKQCYLRASPQRLDRPWPFISARPESVWSHVGVHADSLPRKPVLLDCWPREREEEKRRVYRPGAQTTRVFHLSSVDRCPGDN